MIRILLVANIFPPQIGGPATFIDRLAARLARAHGYRVTVICSSDQQRDAGDSERPFRVLRVSTSNPYRYQAEMRMVLLRELLRHRHVLVNGLERYVHPIAARLGRRYTLKVVGDSAWETARNAGKTSLDIDAFQADPEARKTLGSLIAARNSPVHGAARIVTPSDYLRRMVIGWGIPEDRVVTVPNGVDLDELRPELPEPRQRDGLHVLFVGRLTNWKGVETLLLAVTELPWAKVTIVGDGPEFPHLVELSRQLELGDRVHFAGRQHAAAVHRAMRDADVLVLTSLYEGLSHTLLEASALGTPCIASSCGGNDEVIRSGRNGLLVPPQNVRALREALARLHRDECERQRLALGAYDTGQSFSIARTVEGVANLLVGSTR